MEYHPTYEQNANTSRIYAHRKIKNERYFNHFRQNSGPRDFVALENYPIPGKIPMTV